MIDYNFLSDFTGLYSADTNGTKYTASTYTHDWEFLNVSTTVTLETTNLRSADRFALSLRNPISEEYTFQSPIVEIPNSVLEKDFVFHAMFHCPYPANVQIFLYDWDNDHSSVEPITTQLSAGEWTACFSNIFKFEDENEPVAHARVRIVISEHTSQIVRFTMPHLVFDKPFLDNTYFTYGRQFFPDVYYEIDSQQTSPTFPLMKLWHSLTSVAEGAMKEYIKILPTEYEELSVGLKSQVDSPLYNQFLSSLTNPNTIDENYIQWASMFIGNLVRSGIYITQGGVQTDVVGIDDFTRNQIATRMYGMGLGTRASLKNAARAVIGKEAAVLVSPLWQGDEWSIMVRTLTASTPGVFASGQSSSAVYASLELAKPAGYTIMHQSIDEITFVLDDNDFGVFNESVLG